jgi:hypothetical protein
VNEGAKAEPKQEDTAPVPLAAAQEEVPPIPEAAPVDEMVPPPAQGGEGKEGGLEGGLDGLMQRFEAFESAINAWGDEAEESEEGPDDFNPEFVAEQKKLRDELDFDRRE